MTENNTESATDLNDSGEIVEDETPLPSSNLESIDLEPEIVDAQIEDEDLIPVIVFTDSRTDSLLLYDTIKKLISTSNGRVPYFNMRESVGNLLATLAVHHNEPFGIYMSEDYDLETLHPSLKKITQKAVGVMQITELTVEAFEQLEAAILVVPAIVGQSVPNTPGDHIDIYQDGVASDLSPSTLPGVIYQLCQEASRDMLFIDPPERGLVRHADGVLYRRVLHIRDNSNS